MRFKILLTLFIPLFLFQIAFGQVNDSLVVNLIKNSSFEEGDPGIESLPTHWLDCGFKGETHMALISNQNPERPYGVTIQAVDGEQFIGLVVRDNETNECIGQLFDQPLKGIFEAKILIARSNQFLGLNSSGKKLNFITPAVLEIIGVTEDSEEVVLFRSKLIINTGWELIKTKLEVPFSMKAILLSATWTEPILFPYNGNIVIDAFEMYRSE